MSVALVNVIRDNGIEQIGRYYAQYLAFADNVTDLENRGRITVKCQEVYGDHSSAWCEYVGIAGLSGGGIISMPKKGDVVYIRFMQGDINYPVWIGGVWGQNELPSSISNITIFTKGGGRVDVGDNDVTITSQGAKVIVHNNGTVSIDAKQITLGENADQFAVKGQELTKFLTELLTTVLPTYIVAGTNLLPPPTIAETLTKLPKLLSKVVSLK